MTKDRFWVLKEAMSQSKSQGCTPESCSECGTRSAGLLAGLTDDALAMIDRGKSGIYLKKGDTLFRQGDMATGLYCVGKGLVKSELEGPHGETRMIAVAAPGDFVGYTAIFNSGHQNCTAIASEDAELCFIPKTAIDELIEKHPDFARVFLGKIVRDVKLAQSRLIDQEKTAMQRVAEAVLFLVGRFQEHNWTRKELGDWAGTATETVIRVLSEFSDEGWVTLQGRKILISNENALYEIAGLKKPSNK